MRTNEKLNVFPTQMNLNNLKNQLISYKNGHQLLKKKLDAIKLHHLKLKKELTEDTLDLKNDLFAAFESLSEAEFHSGDLKIFQHQCSKIPIDISVKSESAAGIDINKFFIRKLSVKKALSLSRGGLALLNSREKFYNLLEKIIFFSSIKLSFDKLDEAMRTTNMRVNALENIIIPKIENTIAYIIEEIDENEREEFFRLKQVINKK